MKPILVIEYERGNKLEAQKLRQCLASTLLNSKMIKHLTTELTTLANYIFLPIQ